MRTRGKNELNGDNLAAILAEELLPFTRQVEDEFGSLARRGNVGGEYSGGNKRDAGEESK
jgi:hypothetical protein